MIVVMQAEATEHQIQQVMDRLIELGFDVHRSTGERMTVLGAVGVKENFDCGQIAALVGVREVVRLTHPYKLASRAFRASRTIVDLGSGVRIGGSEVVVMAGPAAVESPEQIEPIAEAVARAGVRVLCAAAFQSRRSPYGFVGMGERGLWLLRQTADRHGLLVVSEAQGLTEIPMLVDFVDMVLVGERNMQNDDLLDALGAIQKPVLLQRGAAATIEELLLAAEHILAGGNFGVALCERGIRTLEGSGRCTLDVSAIPAVQRLSHMPILVDPSQVAGRRDQVAPIARAAVAAGADGLLIAVHNDPDHASVAGGQSLTFEQFQGLVAGLRDVAAAVGRRLA
ncbi:MAG TPA: 3-deoxy-7-phosphoheptulonate synthase [Candidatus Acidoferrales bacterium]|nr:3-deoxy-7-phosphoheptulonate synthase [Candidatus Acidoferrales bacterium]